LDTKCYVVTYNANGGNGAPATASQSFNYGGTALVPSAVGTLNRTGYRFDGWSTSQVASGTIYSNPADTTIVGTTTKTYSPSASIILYAKWTALSFAVSFNANGGTGTKTNLAIVAGTASTIVTNTEITRAGYTFTGWNTAADNTGTAYGNTGSITAYSNVTLYAIWTIKAPAVPTVSAAAGNGEATISITSSLLSTSTNGAPASFTITALDSNGTALSPAKTCTVITPATSCVITGLSNTVGYKFSATATNAGGTSAASTASTTVTPAGFGVTYNVAANGGTTGTASATFNAGTPLVLPAATRNGYTFAGWYSAASGGTLIGPAGGSYSPTATAIVYATWTAITYAVTYNGNGNTSGATPANGAYTSGGTNYSILGANTLVKTGYDFAGWNTAADGSGNNYAAAATYSVSANLNLFAKWTATNYTVTYSLNSATTGTLPTQGTKTIGQTFQLAAATGITKTGFTFGGWSDGTNTYTAGTNYTVGTANVTLTAVWIATYIITYDKNGATAGTAPELASYVTGATGITLAAAGDLLKSGYAFDGWSTTPTGTAVSSPYTVSANTTLYAKWALSTININFAAGTANAAPASPVTLPTNTSAVFGALYTLPASLTASVTANSMCMYFLVGQMEAATYQPGSQYRMTANVPTFTAQWNRVYDVRYILGGGSSTDANIANTDSDCVTLGLCTNGQVITTSVAPTRTGYDFVAWVDQSGESVAGAASYTVRPDHYILYATWTFKNYNITFDAQTGSGAPALQTGNMGQIVNLSATAPTPPAGQNFLGWNTAANGSGTSYGAGAQLILGADNVTLYAQYAAATITVIYAGTKTSGSLPAAQSAASGSSIQLAAGTGFTRTGYNFAGWSDGSQVIAASTSYQMPVVNTQLTAQWTVALPNTPAAPNAVAGDGSAVVTVNPGTGSGGDVVSYTITASPGGASCTVFAPALTCTISPLPNNTSYTFTTTATNATGTTSSSPASTAVKPIAKPDAPSSVIATASNGAATVSFTAPANSAESAPTKYTVTSSPAGGSCELIAPFPNPLACNITGLTNGTAYTFTVVAENALFTSDASTASLAATPKTLPGAPGISAASSTPGTATITVTAPASNGGSAITGYTITSAPGGFTCTVAADANPLACDISTLVNGTSYTFTAVATNIVGNSLASSATTALIPQGAASAPTTISATAGDTKATVTFSGAVTNGSTITGYTVQAYDSNGNAVSGSTCTVTTSTGGGSCEVTGLANGSSYTFKAVTNSTANSSAVTSALSIPTSTIIPASAPDAPTSLEVTSGTGKVTVTWMEPSANGSVILSYTVQAYDAAGNAVTGATCSAIAPALTCDVSSNLVAGNNYTFKVIATNAIGPSTASSASPAAAINAAPSVPLAVTAVSGNALATASWDPPANINGSAITGYTATAYDANNVAKGTCTTIAPIATCTVNGLTNGAPYTFKVTATNGIGTSLASLASSAVIPSTVPNAPTAVSAAPLDGGATVSFTAPVNNGGSAITGYLITASNGVTGTGATSPLNISGLDNGTAYTFTVKALNINGESVASVASTSVTPAAIVPPTVSTEAKPTGIPYTGSTLTAALTFTGAPIPTVTYQWVACTLETDPSSCTDISGATSTTFTLTSAQVGKYLAVKGTATNTGGSITEISPVTDLATAALTIAAPNSGINGTAGSAYSMAPTSTGGTSPKTFAVSSGTLPAGLSIDPATGEVSGTPTTAGTSTITITVTGANGVTASLTLAISIAAAYVAPAPAPAPTNHPLRQPQTHLILRQLQRPHLLLRQHLHQLLRQ
jgi:large repetitive protein